MEEIEVIKAIEKIRKYNTETNKIEVKSANNDFSKKCYDTFSSFSNKHGGLIIFGISESQNFKTCGVYNVNDLQKQISTLCTDSMEPALRVEILPMKFENKNIVAVKVEELPQNKKPCYYKPKGLKKGSYTRIGDRDELMTDYEIYALQSYNDHIFEDTRPVKRATIDDLNREKLENYIVRMQIEKPHFANNSFEKSLKMCGITDTSNRKTYPTLAGTLIFSDYPQTFYPQLFVACVVVPGTELGDTGINGERFIDNKRVEGTIEEMLEETMKFLIRNMKKSVIINSDGKRINRLEYPTEALREAIANALIHRDYSTQTENAYISVNMYNDRIEIINPGILYGTNKLEKLGTATTMEARNPTIVRILEEKASIIENRHTGIPTMKREMKKYGLPEPEFFEERDNFKVVFRNKKSKSSGQQNTTSGQQSTPSGQQNTPSGQQNTTSGQQSTASGQQNTTSGQQNASSGQQSTTSGQQSTTSGQQNTPSGQQSTPSGQPNEMYDNNIKIVLEYCNEPKSIKEIQQILKIKSRQYISTNIIKPLIQNEKIEYTNKKSINARNQKYITIKKNNN